MNWTRFLLVILIAFPIVTLIHSQKQYSVGAVEDELDTEDDTVDIEQEATDEVLENVAGGTGGGTPADDEEIPTTLGKSPDIETNILFIKPRPGLAGGLGPELHSGKPVEFLIGFHNKGSQGFTIETLDASFRYPQDYSFHIQNFTAIGYNKLVKPKEQTTLAYQFYVDESFAGRPFGLTVNLAYRDMEGKPFLDSVYNETITVVEYEEGLDGETFFLYIFLGAVIVLLLVVGQHFLTSFSKKSSKKHTIERGTTDSDDVDFEWIPKSTLREINRNQTSPKQSPRQRKAKKAGNLSD